ncbi:CRP-like cAMP-binding protein [Elusimicrobium simillimum]|uniref:Crp/Fnr family transcriptional regulator n=1 Tax=Elusimicrobium simillimum TaxID=3143438 RepID=UPI003C70615D
MKDYINVLLENPLFKGLSAAECEYLLMELKARKKRFKARETVFLAGEPAREIGIVLMGGVTISRGDAFGKKNIIAIVQRGSLFAEAFACAGVKELPVTVEAAENSIILLLNFRELLEDLKVKENIRQRVIANMLRIISRKNIVLNNKLDLLARGSTRAKIWAYLTTQMQESKSRKFNINMDRNDLADYLLVNRSALSRELSKMQTEGLIKYHKNTFEILKEV